MNIEKNNLANDTTGYTSVGASTEACGTTGGTNNPAGLLVTVSSSGFVSKITARVVMSVAARSTTCKIYSGSSGSLGSLLGTSQSVSVGTSEAWVDFPFDIPVAVTATTYWLEFVGYGGEGGGTPVASIKYDTGGGANTSYLKSDIGVPSYGTKQYSVYATVSHYLAENLSGGDPTVSTEVTDENCLVAVVTAQDSNTNNIPCAGVSRNGSSFTKIAEYGGSGGSGQPCNISIWYLVNPDVGTYNTVADCNGTINECTVTVYRLRYVDTADPVDTYTGGSASGVPAAMTLSTALDGAYLIGGLCSEGSISAVGTGQDTDSYMTDQSYENTRTSSKSAGSAGSKSLSFTAPSNAYAQMLVAFNGMPVPVNIAWLRA